MSFSIHNSFNSPEIPPKKKNIEQQYILILTSGDYALARAIFDRNDRFLWFENSRGIISRNKYKAWAELNSLSRRTIFDENEIQNYVID
ncbi:hypothetical protein QE197_13130 [Arsenophonus nasoniae]|uniref:Uncharacterized protein n=1 Tax=Arsenophonus nasoniae TaxID=638 RepID=A0A4P7KW38_9GAMM|nr:hypothetical protein [Arsenophonus nasoniae]QBY44425.1 hypothetical protein ArsFIN_30110 [Arsenophonus nasoniae]WGM01927.1 hypothetical protein QE210_02000 [Arsenophonus nasoniae]WGM04684.1 hypothetical protein QE258_13865 [Arsenophonus nasoniae]WGM09798.1 hypothetical protein QE197_13130 [Arsenophonus nasoniae]WGM14517.1 hypothetical protein QE193_13030 [Arsenophonus nasoniae]